ncbi:hypothetical protein Pelo_7352 [Pelomyxa schiedti]|nr:hypothetical protein Pelo_7352 [Pelomyxa schiedti]
MPAAALPQLCCRRSFCTASAHNRARSSSTSMPTSSVSSYSSSSASSSSSFSFSSYGIVVPINFTVVTYNVQNYNDGPNWSLRKHLIAQIISSSSADVVALQEIRTTKQHGNNSGSDVYSENMLSDLMELLPQYCFSTYITAMKHSNGLEEGLAVISMWPIFGVNHTQLTWGGGGDLNTRICMSLTVVLRPGSCFNYSYNANDSDVCVAVANTHWSYDKDQQMRNAEDTLSYLEQQWATDNAESCHRRCSRCLGHVVAGDFNNKGSSSPAVELFESHAILGGTFQDSWKASHQSQDQPNTTSPYNATTEEESDLGFTFPTTGPVSRCDHVFTLGTASLPSLTTTNSTNSCGSGPVYPSDHCAVVAKYCTEDDSHGLS